MHTSAVGLLFHDSHLENRSVVSLDDIGEGADALLCLTNSLSCCDEHSDGTTSGMWYFPNSSPVPLESQASGHRHDMYITRGPGVVRLHRRGSSMMPVGIFHCEIPDEEGMNQSIYIDVYSDVQGEGIKINYIIKLSFSSDLLINPLTDIDDTSNFSCKLQFIVIHSAFIKRSNVGEGS